MIQRIQTVYLLAGALLLAVMFTFRDMWTDAAAIYYPWFALVGQILCGLTILAAVAAVFLYRNRSLQRNVIIGAQFLDVAFIFVVYLGLTRSGAARAAVVGDLDWGILIAMAIPVIVYILFYLARRGVDKDIALVKSMDRLR